MTNMPITVPEFIKVRQHLANLLKENSTTQEPTRIRQAENLLSAGVIDVQAVLDYLTPIPVVSSVRDSVNRLTSAVEVTELLDEDIPDPDENSYDNGPDL